MSGQTIPNLPSTSPVTTDISTPSYSASSPSDRALRAAGAIHAVRELGYSLREASREFGLSSTTLHRLMHGKRAAKKSGRSAKRRGFGQNIRRISLEQAALALSTFRSGDGGVNNGAGCGGENNSARGSGSAGSCSGEGEGSERGAGASDEDGEGGGEKEDEDGAEEGGGDAEASTGRCP